MKRHYYVINRGMSHEVMVFNSREDIERWFAVEPVDGFVPDVCVDGDDDIIFTDYYGAMSYVAHLMEVD